MAYNQLTWILQKGTIAKYDFDTLSISIMRLGCNLKTLQLAPFSHEPTGEIPTIVGSCITYGSSGLLSLGLKAGWVPTGWDGASFDVSATNLGLGKLTLNHSAISTTFSEVANVAQISGWKKVFVRPNSETKEFPGQIFSLEECSAWVKKLHSVEYLKVRDSPAIVAPYQQLDREWRFFVVNSKIITWCQYARLGEVSAAAGGPGKVVDFVKHAISIYRPAPCFVVDVAEVISDEGRSLRIVEFNSINSAGFYRCDIDAIVRNLSEYVL